MDRRRRHLAAALAAACSISAASLAPARDAGEEARGYVEFVEDFEANCVSRNANQIQVKSTHPSRTVRVWLDRYHMGVGTGDRSRTDLAPGAAPEPLGCSRTLDGAQEWRIVRARFADS